MSRPSLSERARLQTLANYSPYLQTPAVELTQLTQLAARAYGEVKAWLTVLDTDHLQSVISVGGNHVLIKREHAFCAPAILQNDLFVIEDAAADPHWSNNPYVQGAPHARFYVGAPLTMASGYSVGTLCVLGQQPRQASAAELQQLGMLRDAVVTHLEFARHREHPELAKKVAIVCAWCRNVHKGDDASERWLPIDELLLEQAEISHGMCPECLSSQPVQ